MKIKVGSLLFLLACVARLEAADQVVTDVSNGGDTGGAGQLRAKMAACLSSGGGTITFAAGLSGTITLTSALPTVTKSGPVALTVTIDGGNVIEISGNDLYRVFNVSSGANLTLKNLTVTHAFAAADGGAVANSGNGTITVATCKFFNNQTDAAHSGGALYALGPIVLTDSEFGTNKGGGGGAIYPRFGATLTVTGCNFHDNEAMNTGGGGLGGAILPWDGPTVAISNSTFSNNKAAKAGGAIYVLLHSTVNLTNCTLSGNSVTPEDAGALFNAGTLTVSQCTISGNSAARTGSALYNTGAATLTNTTLSGNTVGAGGGGGVIFNDSSATMTVRSCTIAGNDGPFFDASAHIGNTVIAQNGGTDVLGIASSDGYNFIGAANNGSGFSAATHDQVGTIAAPKVPQLGPLKNNGGSTQTMLPLAGSPLIDQGTSIGLSADQRGATRPSDVTTIPNADDGADIGAVEIGHSLVVTTTADSGPGSFRQTILNAFGGDAISFAVSANGTIPLTSGQLLINKDLTIVGPGADQLTVQRSAGEFRIFEVAANTSVSLSGMTIANGLLTGGGGGGIYSEGTIQLTNVDVVGNKAGFGGGLFSQGSATLSHCNFTGNQAGVGGGMESSGPAVISDSTFTGNFADALGGGIFNYTPGGIINTLQLTNVTLTGNTASEGGAINNANSGLFTNVVMNGNQADRGGALWQGGVPGGLTTLINVTMAQNTASDSGGGLFLYTFIYPPFDGNGITINNNSAAAQGGGIYVSQGTLLLKNATLSGNSSGAGGGILNTSKGAIELANVTLRGNSASNVGGILNQGSATVKNTIFSKGSAGDNCLSIAAVTGFNLSDDNTCHFGNGRDGVNLLLGPLANNGGPTQTHLPQKGSPAIDGGTSNQAPNVDQREVTRPQGSAFDVGAVEVSPSDPLPVLANISTRLPVQTGDNVLIGGFIVTGTQPKKVIIRAVGPSLPVNGALADPYLELHDGTGALLEANDNWMDSPNKQAIIDSTIPPSNNLESAIVRTLPANNSAYTAIVRGANSGTGIGVVEAYDLDTPANAKLANISTRGFVQTGDNILIAGTIVVGQGSQKVIIRAIGPSLSVPGKLGDPTLELRDQNGGLLEANDNWIDSPNKQAITDSTIPPANNLESAIVRTLTPAAYTAIVRGVNDMTGIAVVEVYALN